MTDSLDPDNIAYYRHLAAGRARDLHAGAVTQVAEPEVRAAVDFVEQVTCLTRARRIMEIGCGSGEYAAELARRGHKLIACDPSAPLIDYARTRSRTQGLLVAFLAEDFRELEFPPYFDLILNFRDEAPLAFESDEAVLAALQKICSLLRPAGQLLFGRSDFGSDIRAQDEVLATPSGRERRTIRYDPETRNLIRTITFDPDDTQRPAVTWSHRQRLYTLPEVSSLLDRAGLAVRGVWHTYDTRAEWAGPDRPGRIVLAERVR